MSVLDSASPPITGCAERLRAGRELDGSMSFLLCRLNGSGVLTLTIFLQKNATERGMNDGAIWVLSDQSQRKGTHPSSERTIDPKRSLMICWSTT